MDLLTGQRFSIESHTVAAAYAAWLLAEFGAEVDHRSALDPEGVGAVLAHGAPTAGAGLVADGDTPLISDAPWSEAERTRLRALAANRLVIWMTPWGIDSDQASRPATDLTLQAAGGWMSAVGEPGREPLGAPGPQVLLAAGLYAAVAALAASLGETPGAPRTGLVDIPFVEVAQATTIYDAVAFQYHGSPRKRTGHLYSANQPTITTLPCKDGHIGLHAALHRQFLRICDLIGEPDLPSDPRFADPASRARNAGELHAIFGQWLGGRTRWGAYHELQRAGIPASAHPTLDEVLASPQLAARDYWRTVRTPAGREYRVPGAPARVVAMAGPAADSARPDGPWNPGALRVVDLSMGWAGPLVSNVLASFGADVIKVESHKRFDWWRGSRPPGDDPAIVLHERSHVFNAVNRGKRGLTLDLTTEHGRELALALVDGADVVVENFSAGVIEKLGLTYDTLAARNPRLVMLRQPAWGATGPESTYLAFGNTMEGMSGLTALMGYEGEGPTMLSNAFGDPISGLNGLVAVLAALHARARDGRGRCIEAAQIEAFLPMLSQELIDYQRSGGLAPRRGNARTGIAPCAAFPCAGDDRWLVIDVRSNDEWERLAAIVGEPWATETALQTVEGRWAARKGLEADLAAWTSRFERDTLESRLAAAGIAVSAVRNEADVLSGPLGDGYFEPQERAFVGMHLYPGLPLSVDGVRLPANCPAPTLGEHNEAILAAMGIGAAARDELRSDGIIGERPA